MEFIQIWGGLIFSAVSVIIAIISIIKSAKAQRIQNKIHELDAKIKEYELEEIEKEKTEKLSAIIQARAVKVNRNIYYLKIYNCGNTKAYNVLAHIPQEYELYIINTKMPFEELDPQDGFEERIIVHGGSSYKFKVELAWEDKDGKKYKSERLCSR